MATQTSLDAGTSKELGASCHLATADCDDPFDIQEELKNAPRPIAGRHSNIAEFYRNRGVLITGASGFVGKVIVEKLLRACPSIGKIYVLMRPKRGKQPSERVSELLEALLFDAVRRGGQNEKLGERVIVLEGDVTHANLGLSSYNLARVTKDVSVVFHSAATVKFDEPLKQAIAINIAGTKNIINLCRLIPRLASLVHVSTAYANCDLDSVDEHIYPVNMDPEKLIQTADSLDQDTLQELKARLLDAKPNTYTYTKSMAEWLLFRSARDLPVAICRPSIVVCSSGEPFKGWIDSANGATGSVLLSAKGITRTMLGVRDCVADLIPVDKCVNMTIALGWFAHCYREANDRDERPNLQALLTDSFVELPSSGTCASHSSNRDAHQTTTELTRTPITRDREIHDKLRQFKQRMRAKIAELDHQLPGELASIPVFNCTSGEENPVKWGWWMAKTMQIAATVYPSVSVYRCPNIAFESNKRLYYFYRVTLHYIPAYIYDTILRVLGQKPQLMRIFNKFDELVEVVSFVTTQEWRFKTDNVKILIDELMSEEDKRLFDCDVRTIDWEDYMATWILGIRKFLFKEPMSNLKKAHKNLNVVYYRNLSFQVMLCAFVAYFMGALIGLLG